MKTLTLTLATFLISFAASNFIPVPDYNLSSLEGTWNVQSVYDTSGQDWSPKYCFQIQFQVLNESAVYMTTTYYYVSNTSFFQNSEILYPDIENAAILYQDASHKQAPILVLNSSSIPYWTGNGSDTIIIALNYTVRADEPHYIILGLSQWYDTQYDIRPFLQGQNLPALNYSKNYTNFFFINTACDAHFDWKPQRMFGGNALVGDWNLVAVYEPFGKDIAPWYTQGPLFNWEQASCAKVSFQNSSLGFANKMTLSLNNLLYNTQFKRTWELGITPGLNAALMGFDISGSTLLYVGYFDLDGNMILTAGTTTSFFLSNKTSTLTLAQKAIFEAYLIRYNWDGDYIYDIAQC